MPQPLTAAETQALARTIAKAGRKLREAGDFDGWRALIRAGQERIASMRAAGLAS